MSMRFELVREDGDRILVETQAVGINDVAEVFKAFLLAVGFHSDNVKAVFNEEDEETILSSLRTAEAKILSLTKENERLRDMQERLNNALKTTSENNYKLREETERLKDEIGLHSGELIGQEHRLGTMYEARIKQLEEVVKMAAEASHESGCLGAYNNDSCDCVVSAAKEVLEKK